MLKPWPYGVSIRALFVLSMALIAAACGGGGGDSNSGSQTIPVQLVNPTPARFEADITAGDRVPQLVITAQVTGDLAQLANRTIFVIVEDPHSLFEGTPSIFIAANTGQITLGGRIKSAPATLAGNLRVFVCLDAQCSSQLGNSPLTIPYRIGVHPDLAVQDSVVVSTPFGTVPAPVDLPVTLPFGANSFTVRQISPSPAVVAEAITAPAAAVRVAPRLMPVNTYMVDYEVTAVSTAGGLQRTHSRQFRVTYTVMPSATAVAFDPVSIAVSIPSNDALIRFFGIAAYAQSGTLTGTGFDFSGSVMPPAGDPLAPYGSWVFLSGSYNVSHCLNIGGTTHCMAPGTYVAQVKFTHVDGAVSTEYSVPITLTVTP